MRISIEKNAKILALFAIACTAIVGAVFQLTKDKILEQESRQLLSTLNSIVAKSSYNNELHLDCHKFYDSNNIQQTAYLARKNNKPIAAAVTATAPDGYNGKIEMIIAITIEDKITGVRVLKHNETPGLGDKVELRKSNWINSFTGKQYIVKQDSRWKVKKDGGMFDQFTGATITPRAVVNSVKNTVTDFSTNQSKFFNGSNDCELTP